MKPSITVRDFCHAHAIKVIDSNKRAHRYNKTNIDLFRYNDDYNRFLSNSLTCDTETLYTVEITESELEKIAEFESQVFNNMREHGQYRLFEILMMQKEREKYLKEKYPAVKKAYEQYSLMLKMAESGEL